MQRYTGHTRRGGVVGYDIGPDSIDIEFTSGWIYRFSYQKPGATRVERLKELAQAGRGLSTFINKHVKNRFEKRRHKNDPVAN